MATTQKPKGATGSPQAAARPPQSSGPQTKPADVEFVLEHTKKSLKQVPFSKIVVREADYSFREGSGTKPFSAKSLQPLKEKIKGHGGIHTPIMLRDLGNGTYLLVDGHRRYFSIKQLIEDGVAGFTPDMLLPANVLAAETSELQMIAAGLSANIDRQALAFEGRLKATRKLHELGMPIKSIAQLLGISDSTVERDLRLAGDEEMMQYVRTNCIQATAAAALLASAAKHDRRDDLMAHYKVWLEATKAQISADIAALKSQDADLTVPARKTWPQSYLTPQIVKHWQVDLEKNQPLVDPGFRFKAMVRTDGGMKRIEVDGSQQGRGRHVRRGCRQGASTLHRPRCRLGAGTHRQDGGRKAGVGRGRNREGQSRTTAAATARLGPVRQRAGRRAGLRPRRLRAERPFGRRRRRALSGDRPGVPLLSAIYHHPQDCNA